jgi:hypothetical protein
MRAMTAILVLVLGGGLASAQTLPTPGTGSALGATSPLGSFGMTMTAPVAPTGIGLGATQLTVGGLSPAPNPLGCSTATSGVASAGTTLFDGGGMAGGTTGCSTTGSATVGASSGIVTPGAAPTSASGTGIPLGATELSNAGVSPLVTAPASSVGVMTSPGS